MSYQKNREEFIGRMAAEVNMPASVARLILRHANSIQRYAVMECNGEGGEVDCPNRNQHSLSWCPLCSGRNEVHHRVLLATIASGHKERRITTLCAPYNVKPVFSGDPRGCCVKLQLPSGYSDSWGGDGFCVPTRRY